MMYYSVAIIEGRSDDVELVPQPPASAVAAAVVLMLSVRLIRRAMTCASECLLPRGVLRCACRVQTMTLHEAFMFYVEYLAKATAGIVEILKS